MALLLQRGHVGLRGSQLGPLGGQLLLELVREELAFSPRFPMYATTAAAAVPTPTSRLPRVVASKVAPYWARPPPYVVTGGSAALVSG